MNDESTVTRTREYTEAEWRALLGIPASEQVRAVDVGYRSSSRGSMMKGSYTTILVVTTTLPE